MKLILSVILVLSFVSAFAISEYACLFLAIDPSGANRAIGGDAVGVVNVWNSSPLGSYYNPAVAAFHEGVSFGDTRINWFEDADIGLSLYYDCSIMNIGYHGIAIILPATNQNHRKGISFDYGLQEYTDEAGEIAGYYNSYEEARVFGIAVNPIEVLRTFSQVDPILDQFDFSIGFNNMNITSDLAPFEQGSSNQGSAKASYRNFGFIAKYTYDLDQYAQIEAVYGMSKFNLNDKRISYINAAQSDPIFSQDNNGGALSISIPSEKMLKGKMNPRLIFFDNLFTARYLKSVIKDDYDADITGSGIEVGFLDTFFLRQGKYNDKPGHVVGSTSGYGINLHYKNLISVAYNYAEFPLGELMASPQVSKDYSVSFDLQGLCTIIIKSFNSRT